MSLKFIIGGMLIAGCTAASPSGATCATVRCMAGTTCVEKKNGHVACLADCETTCGNTVPHGWKGKDDGTNCCNRCRCRDGHMQCRKKDCENCSECTYDCTTREVWSDKKKEWCCANENVGCPSTLALGETCYQFCEDGSCEPINRSNDCVRGECIRVPGISFNSHLTCQLPEGATCYQFCEDGSCAPINDREHCTAGTECKGDGTIGFNSHETCQAI
eukprot:TRINITY_DN3928_c1_g1_i3.p1 TRINITY_DN3928_c1_g1~~TRINITY_DN3928_c1_g1_i3.p1  ORF type:complete len:218 (+),score=52.73 TRINITY_DN3928_c1_g1_i3:125-778(+)